MPFRQIQVEQVDEASGNAMAEVTVAVVEAILEPLRPAMVAMRAKVEVRVRLTWRDLVVFVRPHPGRCIFVLLLSAPNIGHVTTVTTASHLPVCFYHFHVLMLSMKL